MENSTAEKEGLEILAADAARAAGALLKTAAVSVDQARRSLDRLDTLERNKPSVGQVARYGGIGALGGAAAGAVGNAIEGGGALRGSTPKAKALNLAASAAKGAIGGGALPMLRAHSDRNAEMGTLRKFMVQDKTAALGAAPLWRAQAGFTPPGMQTAAQRLKKSMSMGTVDPNKGLKPLNIKVGHTIALIVKQAGLMSTVRGIPQAARALPSAAKSLVTGATPRMGHLNEVAGLGILAVPGLDTMQSRLRARMAGDKSPHGAEKRQLLGEGAHAALDVGGLGMLAAPALSHLKHAFANSGYAGNVAQNGPGMKSHSQLPAFTRPALQVKESSPLKRVGELVTGSKAGRLREAALRHADRAADGKLPRELKAAKKLRGLAKAEEGRVGNVQGALVGSAALGAASDSSGMAEKLKSKEAGVGVGSSMTASQYSGPLSQGSFKMTSGIPAFKRTSPTKSDDSLEGAAWMYGQNKESALLAPHEASSLANAYEQKADHVDANPGKYRLGRALNGGLLGAGAGYIAGELARKPGLGAALGGLLGAGIGGIPKPSGSGFRGQADRLRSTYEAKEASFTASTGAMSPAASLKATQRVAGPKTTGFSGPSIADVAKPKGFGMPMPGAQKNQI